MDNSFHKWKDTYCKFFLFILAIFLKLFILQSFRNMQYSSSFRQIQTVVVNLYTYISVNIWFCIP